MIREIVNLFRHKYLLWELVKRDFKAKYIGSKAGLFWSLITPLIRMVIFIFVFSVILKVKFDDKGGITNFALYLICGTLPWFGFQQSIVRSETVLLENSNLVKYIVFPAKIFPFYVTISSLIEQAIGFIFFIAAVFLINHSFSMSALPVMLMLLFMQLIFTVGLGWILSTLNILIKDTYHAVELFLMIWMYLTPIFYPEDMVPSWARGIININPMAYLVRFYRDILLRNRMPVLNEVLLFFSIAIVLFFLGYYIFEKNQHKFADLI